MRIIIVDDEELQLQAVRKAVVNVVSDCELNMFGNPFEALEYVKENKVDVAFLDIRMPGLSGIELAKKMKQYQEMINIIFCTGYSEYAIDAMNVRASGYLTKPIRTMDVERELDNLRNPIMKSKDKIRIQCFGNFEIYINDKTLEFQLEKSKEVLAYLVDRRGAACTNGEISTVLWEDDGNHKSYFQKIRADIKETLAKEGCLKLVHFSWGKLRINTADVSCDYYDFLEGKVSGLNAYRGEYMNNYSWAEYSKSKLFK